MEWVLNHRLVRSKMERELVLMEDLHRTVPGITTVHDGLAVVRAEHMDFSASGYAISSQLKDIDSCIIIRKGSRGMSASFYNNNFKQEKAPMDLTILARHFDKRGGGHYNACGCSILPEPSIDEQVKTWIRLWKQHTGRP